MDNKFTETLADISGDLSEKIKVPEQQSLDLEDRRLIFKKIK